MNLLLTLGPYLFPILLELLLQGLELCRQFLRVLGKDLGFLLLHEGKRLVTHLCSAFLVLLDSLCKILLFHDIVFLLYFLDLILAAGNDALDLWFDAFEGVLCDLVFFLFLPFLSRLLFLLCPQFLVVFQPLLVIFF